MHQDWVMTTATVKFFNVQKGFGFISPEDGGQDVFVQVTAVEQAGMTRLTEGQRVSFEDSAGQTRHESRETQTSLSGLWRGTTKEPLRRV